MDIREIKNQAIEEIDNGNRVAARQKVDWLFGAHLVLQTSESYSAYDEANQYVQAEFYRAFDGLDFVDTRDGVIASFGGFIPLNIPCGDIAFSPAINGETAHVAATNDMDTQLFFLLDIDDLQPTSEQLGGVDWDGFYYMCERHLTETLEAETAE